jgi:two-component system cell cycle sensor histidine kinase/response regulator CckA
VLLVDDEPTLRKMTRRMLQSCGFEIFDASSGADALAIVQEHSIDILVTDVVMNGMDGIFLADTLVGRRPDLKVLFISGYPFDVQAAQRRYARCAFLPKPFQKSELLNTVTRLSGAES